MPTSWQKLLKKIKIKGSDAQVSKGKRVLCAKGALGAKC
jgi:hypothetical protein